MKTNIANAINNFLTAKSKKSIKVGKGVIGSRKLPAALKEVGKQ